MYLYFSPFYSYAIFYISLLKCDIKIVDFPINRTVEDMQFAMSANMAFSGLKKMLA